MYKMPKFKDGTDDTSKDHRERWMQIGMKEGWRNDNKISIIA